ncbi:4Fe-4S dicluster domain-containing protein, partial [Vibrio parahaemolyticus]|nr:4Fe-4S dicluster domain-containing protein [Vibrio parahaemolyticus]
MRFYKQYSVFLSCTQHEENQHCNLVLNYPHIPIDVHLVFFDEPCKRFFPAGVYVVVDIVGLVKFQINAG